MPSRSYASSPYAAVNRVSDQQALPSEDTLARAVFTALASAARSFTATTIPTIAIAASTAGSTTATNRLQQHPI